MYPVNSGWSMAAVFTKWKNKQNPGSCPGRSIGSSGSLPHLDQWYVSPHYRLLYGRTYA